MRGLFAFSICCLVALLAMVMFAGPFYPRAVIGKLWGHLMTGHASTLSTYATFTWASLFAFAFAGF